MKYQILICVILYSLAISHCQLVYNLIGGLTDTSFIIKAKGKDSSSLNLYKNQTLYGTYSPDANLYFSINVTGLNASTIYNFRMDNSGKSSSFNVTTFPPQGSQASLSFIVGSNAYTNTGSYIFDRILSTKPQFFMFLGNIYSSGGVSEEALINGKHMLT